MNDAKKKWVRRLIKLVLLIPAFILFGVSRDSLGKEPWAAIGMFVGMGLMYGIWTYKPKPRDPGSAESFPDRKV